MSNTNNKTSIIGFLGIAFVILKLTGVITWSWWWVTLPFWGGFVPWFIAMIIIGITTLINK